MRAGGTTPCLPSFLARRRRLDHRAGDLSCTFERNSPPRRPDNFLPKLPRAVPRSPLFPAFKEPGAAQRYEIVRVPPPALPVVPEQVGCPVARPSPVPSVRPPFRPLPSLLCQRRSARCSTHPPAPPPLVVPEDGRGRGRLVGCFAQVIIRRQSESVSPPVSERASRGVGRLVS